MSSSAEHYVKKEWSADELNEFRKAFLAKYLKIKKSQVNPAQYVRNPGKETPLSLAERNAIQTTDLNQKNYGDTAFVTSGLEQILGKKIAMPQYLTSYPPTQKYFDQYAESPGSPADRARLLQSVAQVLQSEGYSSNQLRNAFTKIPYVADIVNGYFDPRDPGMRNLDFTTYVQEQQAQYNTKFDQSNMNDVIQHDPSSGMDNIDVHQFMPQVTQSYAQNQFDKTTQDNLIKYLMHQRMGNLHFTLKLLAQISASIVNDIRILTVTLRQAAQMTHVTNSNAKAAHELIMGTMRKLAAAYPTYIQITMTPNDALERLKQLKASNDAAYNSTIDSVYSGEINLPNDFARTSESKYLQYINPEEYRKVLNLSLNSVELSDQQKDMVRQELDRNQNPTMATHMTLLKNLNKYRTDAQNPEYLNNLFSLNTALGLAADELGPIESRKALDYTLRQQAHNELENNNLGNAVQCINALSNPTLPERNYLDFAEKYDYNYKFFDSSNPLIADIWYKDRFLQNTDQSIFNDWTNIKNMVSGFISRKQLDGEYPTPNEMQVFQDARTNFVARVDEQLKRNPNNPIYNAMKSSNAILYDTDILYDIFSHPQSPYLASVLGQQNFVQPEMVSNDPNASHEPKPTNQIEATPDKPGSKYNFFIPRSKELEEEKSRVGGAKGGLVHNYLKRIANAWSTAKIANTAYGDLGQELSIKNLANKALKNHSLRFAIQLAKDVPDFLNACGEQGMEFYQQTPQHQTMSSESQVFDSVIRPIEKLQLPDFSKLNFEQYDKAIEDNDYSHDSNMHHIGGIMTYGQKTFKKFTPQDLVIRDLYRMKHNPSRNVGYKQVEGCKTCGSHSDLNGHDNDHSDITCDSCLANGMTSKRVPAHLRKHYKIGGSPHKAHQDLHNTIENNKLFEKIQSEPIKNNWDDFQESAPKLNKTIELWKKSYVMDRDIVKGDLNKLVYALGKFLYDEEDTNDTFLDNLNSTAIKYLASVDKDDSITKRPLPSGFHTFEQLKGLVEKDPGILHTLIIETE